MDIFSNLVKTHDARYNDENQRDEASREILRRPLPEPVHALDYGFGPPEARGFYRRHYQKAEL